MDIYKHEHILTDFRRRELFSGGGAVIWLTGLSGSGKSTIAALVEKLLCEKKLRAYMLDGDNLRFSLNADLGFSDEHRSENIRRIGAVAALFAHSGTIAIVSAISPFKKDREKAKYDAIKMNVPFVEVFVDTPIEICAQRDTKGLYKRAYEGTLSNFTGVDSPYEAPDDADITVKTTQTSAQQAAEEICEYIMLLHSLKAMIPEIAETAIQAGERIMSIYNTDFSVEKKADSSPLTQADLASNEIICSFLKSHYPDFSVLSEETKDDKNRMKNDCCFIVDPLDGTKEFVKRNGEFTVNIALAYKNKTVLGVVFAPCDKRLWYAAKGCGAYCCNSLPSVFFNEEDRITVSDKCDKLTIMASRSHCDEKLTALLEKNSDKIGDIMSVGSSLKGCLIAEGKAEVYYRTGLTCEWDTAAMQCIVEQAGGVFRQSDGSPMHYNRENTLNEKGFYILNKAENLFDMP